MIWRILRILTLAPLIAAGVCQSQYVQLAGTLQAANGLPAANYSIDFKINQFGFIAGSGVVINTDTYCGTDPLGSVVGITNPLQRTINTAAYTSGTLPAGNYFVEFAWYTSTGTVTQVSPESTAQLTATGQLDVAPPSNGVPAGAAGMVVAIGTSSGGERFQGLTTGANVYTQSVPLVLTVPGSPTVLTPTSLDIGSPLPIANTTICKQVANDAIWPVGTGYTVSLTDPSGNTLPGYPMMWQLLGPNTTINVSNGLPYYHGVVTFPSPILASPQNHATQSISGPLSLGSYALAAGSVTASGAISAATFNSTTSATATKPVFDITSKAYAGGAVGDGVLSTASGTANYPAVQAAINACTAAGGGTVLVPCGVYEIGQPLTMYGYPSCSLRGASPSCSILQYNGASPQSQGFLTVAVGAPATSCTSTSCNKTTGNPGNNHTYCCAVGFQEKDLSLVGNANVPDCLDLLAVVDFDISNVNMIGCENTSDYLIGSGNGKLFNLGTSSNVLYVQTGGFSAYATPNGTVIDGFTSGASTQIVDESQGSSFHTGKAIWIEDGDDLTFSNCQLSGNAINVQVDSGAGNAFNYGCLSEAGTLAGAFNIGTGATATLLDGVSASGPMNISGRGTTVRAGSLNQFNVASTATATLFDHVDFVGPLTNMVDSAPDTEYRCFINAAIGDCYVNLPAWRRVPPGQEGGSSNVVHLTGSWNTTGTAIKLDIAPLETLNTDWLARFTGVWDGSSDQTATTYEFSQANTTVTLTSGIVATVAPAIVGSSKYLELSATGAAYFTGDIDFFGSAYGPSWQFANPLVVGNESGSATYLACFGANGQIGHCTTAPSGTPPTCGCTAP